MPAYFFRSERTGGGRAAALGTTRERESGRVCQRVLMIANMRLLGLSRSADYEWHNLFV
jgi:hypothetical protein